MFEQLGLFSRSAVKQPIHGDPDGLRYYQRECVDRIIRAFDFNRAVLAVLATGLGKTQIFSAIAKHWDGPVLILAHRAELVDQAAGRIVQMTGESVDIDQAQTYSGRRRIIVGSVQTVSRPKRIQRILEMWEQYYPTSTPLIITDEAHHYVAESFRRPLDKAQHARILGVTATPGRADAKALGRVFDDYPFVMGIEDGIEQGWLVPIDAREVRLAQVNLDNVDTVAGDLKQGELDQEMLKGAEVVARETLRYAGDRQGIVFCPGVKSAHLATAKFNALKPHCASCVDGKTPKEVRERIVHEFRAGKIQYLVNCQVATEGFDAPRCSAIVLMRCTKSLGLYTQMIGRGLRTLPGDIDAFTRKDESRQRRLAIANSEKKNCLLLDFVGVGRKHKLVNAVDVLGGKYTDDEVAEAKKRKKANPTDSASKCLRDAREHLRKVAEKSKARVSSHAVAFDPFRVMHLQRTEEGEQIRQRFGHQPLTTRQKETLEKQKVPKDVIKKMSRSDYSRFLNATYARRRKGLATYRQLAYLQKHGFHDINVTFGAAKKGLDFIAAMGWGRKGRIPAHKLAEIIRKQAKHK